MDPLRPYNELALLPPAVDVETPAVLKRVIATRDQLARARVAMAALPNPEILLNSVTLLEARDSSAIENIVTTSDALFTPRDASAATDQAAKEALRYRAALFSGLESMRRRPLSTNTAIEICSALHGRPMDVRKLPGTALADGSGNVVYTPPVGEGVIRDQLANWEQYLHDEAVDPFVRLAVTHYQFEAIHPFSDGNGRTGRIVNSLLLVSSGLIEHPTLYLSRYILEHRSTYYQHLRAVTTDDAWEPWILFMIDGIADTANWTHDRADRIRTAIDAIESVVRREAPLIPARDVVDLLFTQPYCRIANIVNAGLAHRQTASTWLKRLCSLGVLEERTAGRDKIFINRQLMDILEG